MEFSIILPTRKRTNLLHKILDSIELRTKNLNEVEVFLIFDNDDRETERFTKDYKRSWIMPLVRSRGDNLSRDYYNWCLQFTSGNYLWAMNDDAEIETQDWDSIILEKMKPYRVGMGSVSCPHYDFKNQIAPFSYFPIMNRETVKRLGYFMPEEFPGWGADDRLAKIFGIANKNIPIPEVRINHINGKNIKDECSKAMELRSYFGFADVVKSKNKIEEDARKLI
jgi:hypothetical protein